jgi:hypothetical protein
MVSGFQQTMEYSMRGLYIDGTLWTSSGRKCTCNNIVHTRHPAGYGCQGIILHVPYLNIHCPYVSDQSNELCCNLIVRIHCLICCATMRECRSGCTSRLVKSLCYSTMANYLIMTYKCIMYAVQSLPLSYVLICEQVEIAPSDYSEVDIIPCVLKKPVPESGYRWVKPGYCSILAQEPV